MISVKKADDLHHHLDQLQHCKRQRRVSERMLQTFTEISQDNPLIHTAEADVTVIPGNLLISLIPAMLQSGLQVESFEQCKTVTLSKVRFFNAAGLNEPLDLQYKIKNVRRMRENCFVTVELFLNATDSKLKILTAEQIDCYEDELKPTLK